MHAVNAELTKDEQATNYHTMCHIARVRDLLNNVVVQLLRRGALHDQSKLEQPEVTTFSQYTARLATVTFGSEQYKVYLEELKPALQHHYAKNAHHPEHYKNGIDDMNLIDLIEMLVDWKAASERHNDGNIRKSLEHNAKRFDMAPQLVKVFENTLVLLDGV